MIPAAGTGSRLAPLPFSKEMFPIGFRRDTEKGDWHPKVAAHYLLEGMRLAEISKAFIVLRKGKWDIPGYFADGILVGMRLAYLLVALPYGVPFTLDQAYPFVKDSIVAFGFPDILFDPADAFARLLSRLSENDADMVLGAFPVSQPEKWDMVRLEPDGRVSGIHIKPKHSSLRYTWIIAVWGPNFTHFLHEYVLNIVAHAEQEAVSSKYSGNKELFLSQVVEEALKVGMQVQSVIFQQGKCVDIGTAVDLARAVKQHNIFTESMWVGSHQNDR